MKKKVLVIGWALLMWFASASATAQEVTVPFNVGVGPTFNWITGPVADDQTIHFGLRLKTYLAIDRRTRMKYIKHIPKQFRGLARRKGEIRFDPIPWYVPRSILISPKVGKGNTGVYGLTLRPIGLGLSVGGLRLGLGLIATYAYIHSDAIPSPTHFLRPGIDVEAALEIPLARKRKTALTIAWASQFYIPQTVGGSLTDVGGLDESIWHIGQVSVLLNFRFDFTARIDDYI